MAQTITFQGKPLTLIGDPVTIRIRSPEFEQELTTPPKYDEVLNSLKEII